MSPPADLTPNQWAAVDHAEGALLVLAGPGSGKTRVITRRIARLIEKGVSPRGILAITFTNKAAREMESRVRDLVPGSPVWVSTFHKLCARLLRIHAGCVGLQQNFSILDTSDQRTLLRGVLSDLDVDTTRFPVGRVAGFISQAKNRMESAVAVAEEARDFRGGYFETVAAKIYTAYQKALLQSNAVDFDDLLLHVSCLLSENPEIRSELDERFRYILVDEYQDTNLAQYRIVTALSQNFPNLCATGDPDQSIYGWRGAEIGNILRFERDFPDCQVVRLEQNYRSTKAILRVADRLIAHNVHRKHKDLFTENEEGTPVESLCFYDEKAEAAGIAALIAELAYREQRSWSDFAICYRVNALSRPLEVALARQKIPFQVAAGLAFYERAEVKDVLAYLRLLHNPLDQTAFLRAVNTPARGIGKTTQAKVVSWAAWKGVDYVTACRRAGEIEGLTRRAVAPLQKFGTLCDNLNQQPFQGVAPLLIDLLKRSGYLASLQADSGDAPREDNVEELVTAAQDYDQQHPDDASLEGFLETTSLVSDVDALDADAGQVTLMTLHAAKGLEFPVVFIVALEEKILPHERALNDHSPQGLEEERRLLFVGMTRAEERLYLTRTEVRDFRGQRYSAIPSSFYQELHLDETCVVPGSAFSAAGEAAFSRGEACDDPPDDSDDAADSLDFDVAEFESPPREPGNATAARTGLPHESAPPPRAPRAARNAEREASHEDRTDPAARLAHWQQTGRLTSAAQLLGDPADLPPAPSLFQVGMSVRHPRLGMGRITQATGSGKWQTVTVEFLDGTSHSYIVHKSPLQPVGNPSE